MMYTVGLISSRTTSSSNFKLFNLIPPCSEFSLTTLLPSLVVQRDSLAIQFPVQRPPPPSGVTRSFTSSTIVTRMISDTDLTTSSGFNSGIMEGSPRLLSLTPPLPRSAHSCSYSRKLAFCEEPVWAQQRRSRGFLPHTLPSCGLVLKI